MNMTGFLRVPEVARRLGIEGPAVYRLIERGSLLAAKGQDGFVYVDEDSLAQYRATGSAARS